MIAIWKREWLSYFTTAAGYVFMGVFLTLASVMFFVGVLMPRSGDLLTFIGQLSYLWMLATPVLTMRQLAEERQRGTEQLLLTSPVPVTGIVLGKYLAAVSLMLVTVLLTGLYAGIVALYGRVYPGELLTGALGFVLQGCAFIAVDLFVSGLASSQVTAAILALGVNFLLWMMDLLAAYAPAWLGGVMTFLSLYSRNEPFLMGQLSFASIGFDVSVTAVFLALTIHVLDSRRYRGA